MEGARFSENVGSSKNVPKNIVICPEALISHFRFIKNHTSQTTPLKNQGNPKTC